MKTNENIVKFEKIAGKIVIIEKTNENSVQFEKMSRKIL